MWLALNKNILSPKILIDCRGEAFDEKSIAPTYKLAKKYNIIQGNIFSIDSLFFALFFLNDFEEFKVSSAVVCIENKEYYLSSKEIPWAYKIEKLSLEEFFLDKDFDWVSSSLDNVFKNRGVVKLDKGYIVIKG